MLNISRLFFFSKNVPYEGFYVCAILCRKQKNTQTNTFAAFLHPGSQLMTDFSFLAELGLSLGNL